jgi:DMSO/TMAO reductase YedYZ molybdopterin-dependent catalytic subunit
MAWEAATSMAHPGEIHRRRFVQQAGAATALAALHAGRLSAQQPANVVDFIPGKDARLLGHELKTGEIETPLALLREHRLTPKELLFVRNNQVLAGALNLKPAELRGWTIEFAGLVDRPVMLAADVLGMLPQVEQEVVLQCSGNGRAFFSRAAKAEGVPWQRGAMGNVRFRGVPLAVVIEHLRISIQAAAEFVSIEGADSPDMPGAADFEHSVPLEDALRKSLLVLEMNGERLPQVHGGPVRFLIPGYYATMNVKWARRLRFESNESSNRHHAVRYRTPREPIVPGTPFTATLGNSDPNWNMKIKSVIFSPLDGETLSAGMAAIRGVAWNDGGARMEAVEVSLDGGRTWRRANLEDGAGRYAWHHWSIDWPLRPGMHSVMSRAVDERGRAQPLNGSIDWNPAGYAWNGVDQATFRVV